MTRDVIVTPTRRDDAKRLEPVVFAEYPTYELVAENDDGTWTIRIPD